MISAAIYIFLFNDTSKQKPTQKTTPAPLPQQENKNTRKYRHNKGMPKWREREKKSQLKPTEQNIKEIKQK